jgi:hypothetical protein
MSLSLLGLLALLLALIATILVAQSYKEHFAGHEPVAPEKASVSPVMANLTDAMKQTDKSKPVQVNALERDADVIKALNDQDKKGCPVCKEQCPDMSKYIRRDSIPCWNCSL